MYLLNKLISIYYVVKYVIFKGPTIDLSPIFELEPFQKLSLQPMRRSWKCFNSVLDILQATRRQGSSQVRASSLVFLAMHTKIYQKIYREHVLEAHYIPCFLKDGHFKNFLIDLYI